MLKGDHLELLSLDPEKAMFKIFLSFLVTIELIFVYTHWASLVVQMVKNYLQCKRLGSIPGLGKYLEKRMATHFSILAWRIPWTEEPGRLQSIGSQRVRHD